MSVAHDRGDWSSLLRAYDIGNPHWLCHPCHVAKTGDDRRRANNLASGKPEDWNLSRHATPPGQQALSMTAAPE